MKKFITLLSGLWLALALGACDTSTTPQHGAAENTPAPAAGQTAANAGGDTQRPALKVATPMDYTAVENAALGVNENGKGLEPGTEIVALTIADIHGKPFELQQAWREQPALVIFYRGGWCPFCNMQVRELSVKYPQLQAAGVQALLISVDEPDKAAMVDAQYEIPFPVLSDPKLIAHEAFNVVLELSEENLARYREYGLDLSAWSGQEHNKIAVSSVFLIDQSGTVLFSHAPEDFRSRPSVEQLVAVIESHLTAE